MYIKKILQKSTEKSMITYNNDDKTFITTTTESGALVVLIKHGNYPCTAWNTFKKLNYCSNLPLQLVAWKPGNNMATFRRGKTQSSKTGNTQKLSSERLKVKLVQQESCELLGYAALILHNQHTHTGCSLADLQTFTLTTFYPTLHSKAINLASPHHYQEMYTLPK